MLDAVYGVVDAGLVPKPLRALIEQAFDREAKWEASAQLVRELRERLDKCTSELRGEWRRKLSRAHADQRAVAGDDRATARVTWVRLVRWQRDRCAKLAGEIAQDEANATRERQGIASGTKSTGEPYAASTLYQKRLWLASIERRLAASAEQAQAMTAVAIPTYGEWCAMLGLVVPTALEPRETLPPNVSEEIRVWHQAALERQGRLAEQERALLFAQHRLRLERETFDEGRLALADEQAALVESRTELRAAIVAEVRHDHEALLREIGELERRRRAALAFLPAEPTQRAPRLPRIAAVPNELPENLDLVLLRSELLDHGISQADVARAAGTHPSSVCQFFAGRMKSARIAAIARRLLDDRKKTPDDDPAAPPPSPPRVATEPGGESPSCYGGLPRLAARLQDLGLTHYQVAVLADCSRGTVSAVLHGRLARRRGIGTTIVDVAERLIADVEAGNTANLPPRAPNAGAWTAAHAVDTAREGLRRERAELDELRRQAAAERAAAARERRGAVGERKRAARAAETLRAQQQAMYKTAGLRQRLAKAGVLLTQVARAACVDLSAVNRVLSGTYYSARVVSAAEKLIRARASKRGNRKGRRRPLSRKAGVR